MEKQSHHVLATKVHKLPRKNGVVKGYKVEFTMKTLYLFKHVSEICFIQHNHVNQNGLQVHEDLKMGGIYTFVAHLSQQT